MRTHSPQLMLFNRSLTIEEIWKPEIASHKSISTKFREIDEKTKFYLDSNNLKDFSNFVKTTNREDLFKKLMIKNLYNEGLQLLAVHHILTGPDRYTIDDLSKILQPIRKIRYLTQDQQKAVYTMFEDKPLEEAYKTIHTVYGRFPEIEDQLVMLYSIAVLEHDLLNDCDEEDLTGNESNIWSRVKTEIRNISWKENIAILKDSAEKSLYWYSHVDRSKLCVKTWIALVFYHELFTQHSSTDESEEYLHLIKKLTCTLKQIHGNESKYLPYYFETCFDLQTTPPEQCMSILSNMFDSNLSFARKIKLEFVKHLHSKLSPDLLKSNALKVVGFIVKCWDLKWSNLERENILQLKNELESVLTSTDTTHQIEMLMKYTQEIFSKELQAYTTLMTWELIVTRGKHEQLTVVSKYLDAITHQLEPDQFRFYSKTCLPELNPTEKVEWIHKHYNEQMPVIGAILKVEVCIELLMKKDYETLKEIGLNICQHQLTHIRLLHLKIRADLELVSYIVNNRAISNKLIKKLSCDRLSAYINMLLHLYAKGNEPEIEKVLKDIIQPSIEGYRHCTDSDQVCCCYIDLKQHTRAGEDENIFKENQDDAEYVVRHTFGCKFICGSENPYLDSTENIERIWTNLPTMDDITCKKQHIAKLVLDTDISKCTRKYLYNRTMIRLIAPVLQIEVNVKYDKFIYKCFCIVRHHNRVDHAHDKEISKYREAFPFLKAMEANDEMEKLSLFRTTATLLILLLLSSALGQTSSQLKKYLAFKYDYEDAILYLLWCSGDVEINPGPTLKKLRKVPDSQKERSWIYDSCTVLLKVINGYNLETKTDRLWEKSPIDWPTDEPFYNPRIKQKGGNYDDQKLMKNLFELSEKKGKPIPQHFQNEYTAWINKRKKVLFQLYTCRTESKTLSEAVQNLAQYKDDDELKTYLQGRNIHIILPTQTLGSSKPTIHYPDIVRDLITTICRLCKGLPPTEKSDGIWNTPPKGWNKNHKYYSPNNAGKRTEKDQDKKLLNNLITCCESNKIVIPPEVSVIIRAWQTGNSKEVCKQYTIWASVYIIDHSLKYLKKEEYLDTALVQQCLEKIGIYRTKAKNQEDSGKHLSNSTEQPKSKTELRSSSNTVRNDTETPSTSCYNTGSLVKSVDDSAVKSGLISSACEDVSMVVPFPLDQSVTNEKGKQVKRKYKTTEDQEPAKKVATSSVQVSVVKNPTNVKDDTSKSTDSVQDSPTLTTTSEDDNSKTDNKDNSNIQQINQMVDKTSSNATDQNNGSPDSANSSPTIHKDSSQDGRLTPKQDPPENSKNKPEESSSGTVIDSLSDTNKCTNNPNDTTTDEMDVDKIQNQLNALNNDLPQEFDEDLDTYLNTQNLQSNNLDHQDIDITKLCDDL